MAQATETSSTTTEAPQQPNPAQVEQMVDGDGNTYSVSANDDGKVLESASRTLYLGASCDASSPGATDGTWGWANGGVSVTLGDESIGFPRQESPFEDGRCAL